MKHLNAPETAAMLGTELTEAHALALEHDLAHWSRAYGRATAKVRKLRALLKRAEDEVKDCRREMRLLISVRKA